eukprot:scaffold4263_cov124-Skeletonema_marinoi.AAC.7
MMMFIKMVHANYILGRLANETTKLQRDCACTLARHPAIKRYYHREKGLERYLMNQDERGHCVVYRLF